MTTRDTNDQQDLVRYRGARTDFWFCADHKMIVFLDFPKTNYPIPFPSSR